MKRKWCIYMMWNGREPELLYVYGRDGRRRPAEFHTKVAAKEAQYIINKLTTASTYEGTTIVRVPEWADGV